ncbi:MAG: amidohydrolase family protein [Planctomycetota bacterium]|nr:amidohydrolase family protein [Planctomycetota bacterium]
MLLTATLLLGCAPASMPAQQTTILRPDAIVAEDGSLQEGMAVVIKDGKIVEVAASPMATGTEVQLDGVLAPGMVDCFSGRGADRFLTEQSEASTPDLLAVDGLDMDHPAWQALLERGVTTVHITPDPTNVLAGWGTVVSAAGESRKERLLQQTSHQIASLLQSSVSDNRIGPTSMAGAIERLNQSIAKVGIESLDNSAWFFVENSEGVSAAKEIMDSAKTHQFRLVLWGEVADYGGVAAGQLVGIPTFGNGAVARHAETWKRMAKAGTSFAFGSRGGSGEWNSLRTSAMTLSRFLGNPGAAWAAVSSNPAKMLGMDDQIGSLRAGQRADLVLWSAHPLDASAAVQSVLIGGDTVYRAPAPEDKQ